MKYISYYSVTYLQAQELPGVKVFRFEGALMFASFDYFRSKLIEKTGLDPIALRKDKQKAPSKNTPSAIAANPSSASPFSPPPVTLTPSTNDPTETDPLGSPSASAESGSGPEQSASSDPSPDRSELQNEGVRHRNGSHHSNGDAIPIPISSSPPNALTTTDIETEGAVAAGEHEDKQSTELIRRPTSIGVQMIESRGQRDQSIRVHHIVLDCSVWAFVDDTAVIRLGDVSYELCNIKHYSK